MTVSTEWELGTNTNYRYRLTCWNASSARYGVCEVCGQHVNEVYNQTEERCYDNDDRAEAWTHHNCHSLVGHKDCLISKRK